MSSSPKGDNKPTQDAQRESAKETNHPDPPVPLTPTKSESPPSSAHCQITCKAKKDWWDKTKPFVECAVVILLTVYTGYTVRLVYLTKDQVRIAEDTYNTSQRPYVGGAGFEIVHVWYDTQGKQHTSRAWTKESTDMSFTGLVKNYGPVPGRNFIFEWKVFLDGQERKGTKIEDTPNTIYPTQVSAHVGAVHGSDYQRIKQGTGILDIEMRVGYDGPAERYSECERYEYQTAVDSFVSLGACKH